MSSSLIERVRRAGLPAVGVVGDDWMAYAPDGGRLAQRLERLGRLARIAGRLLGHPDPGSTCRT